MNRTSSNLYSSGKGEVKTTLISSKPAFSNSRRSDSGWTGRIWLRSSQNVGMVASTRGLMVSIRIIPFDFIFSEERLTKRMISSEVKCSMTWAKNIPPSFPSSTFCKYSNRFACSAFRSSSRQMCIISSLISIPEA